MSNCGLCGKKLNVPGRIMSYDCGGDCYECMAIEEEKTIVVLNIHERDIILAALRLWQQTYGVNSLIEEIATNSGEHETLDDSSIDELCERINT